MELAVRKYFTYENYASYGITINFMEAIELYMIIFHNLWQRLTVFNSCVSSI